MSASEIEKELENTPIGSAIMPYLTMVGLLIVAVAFFVYLSLSGTIADYYSNPKSVRDGAQAGSNLLTQLQTIKSTSSWIVPLTFVGLASLVTAISASLTGIKKLWVCDFRFLKTRYQNLQKGGENYGGNNKH